MLNDEFQASNDRNPIDNIKSRIKKPKSIYEKLEKRGLPITLVSIMENLHDVAGIRVICPFIDDIYAVADLKSCADVIYETDLKMQAIRKNLEDEGKLGTE